MNKRFFASLAPCVLALSLYGSAAVGEEVILAPSGLHAGEDGMLMVTDLYHHAVWQRDADGAVTRVAGRDGVQDVNGLPQGGYNDGEAARAAFQTPWAVAPYLDGWAVTDTENNAVRYLTNGTVSTLAGGKKVGKADGVGFNATFDGPSGLVSGPDGCLYLSDTGNNSIRMIDTKGAVTTYIADGAGLLEPTGLCWANGVLYIADSGNNRICKVEDGVVTVLAGGGADADGHRDGGAVSSRFSHPQGIAVGTDGIIYIADTGNGAIRALQDGVVFTVMEMGQGENTFYPISPRSLVLTNGKLYVGDIFAHMIFFVDIVKPTYSDVPAQAWYAPAVEMVSVWGIMGGVEQEAFAPSAALTGDMCTALLKELTTFLPDGLTLPEFSSSGPRTVTRSELAALLWRCAGSPVSTTKLDAFSDADFIPSEERDAVRWCVGCGILKGRPGQILDPTVAVSRAEAAQLIFRFLSI